MKSFIAILLIGIFAISTLASGHKERSFKFLELDPEDQQEDAIGIFVPIQEIIAVNNDESDEDDSIGVHVPLYMEDEDLGETINVFVPMEEFLFEVEDQTEGYMSDLVSASEVFIHDEEEDSIGIFVTIEAPEAEDEQEDAVAVYVTLEEIVDGVVNEEEYMIVQDVEVEVAKNEDAEIGVFVPLDTIDMIEN